MRTRINHLGFLFPMLFLLAFLAFLFYRLKVTSSAADPDYVRQRLLANLSAVPLMFSILATTAFLLFLLQAVFSRWKELNVFISYHHEKAGLAEWLCRELVSIGLLARYIAITTIDHDALIDNVRRHIRSCDVLLVLPEAKPSFAEAEVLAASSLGKVIVIVSGGDDTTELPSTAFQGYPVFQLDRLKEMGFVPLKHFLDHVCRHGRDMWPTLRRGLRKMNLQWLWPVYIVGAVIGSIEEITPFVSINAMFDFYAFGLLWYFLLATFWLFGIWVLANLGQRRAAHVARQTVLTGQFGYDWIKASLGDFKADRDILECLKEIPLQPRYGSNG